MKKFCYFICLTGFLAGCTSSPKPKGQRIKQGTGQFVEYDSRDSIGKMYFTDLAECLRIPTEGDYINCWFNYGLVDSGQVLSIHGNANHAKGRWSNFLPAYNREKLKMQCNWLASADVSPNSGWTTLFKDLEELQLYQLPTVDSLPGFSSYTFSDPCWIFVEMSKKGKYRSIAYYDPGHMQQLGWQVENINVIASLLKNEFKLKYLECGGVTMYRH